MSTEETKIEGAGNTEAITPAAATDVAAQAAVDPVAAVDPAAATEPPAPTPEQLAEAAKQKEREDRRQRLREIAENKSAAFRAQQEARAAREYARRVEAQRQADLERAKQLERYERIEKDPDALLALLRERGVGSKHIAEILSKEGTPEAIEERIKRAAQEAAEAKIKALEQKQEQERIYAARASALRGFVSMVHSSPDKYPALTSLYTPQQLANEVHSLLLQASERGLAYDDDEWAEFLEQREKPRYNRISERLKGGSQSASSSTSSKQVVNGTSTTRAPAVTNSGATLGALPANFDDLSDDEQNKILVARWRAQQKR